MVLSLLPVRSSLISHTPPSSTSPRKPRLAYRGPALIGKPGAKATPPAEAHRRAPAARGYLRLPCLLRALKMAAAAGRLLWSSVSGWQPGRRMTQQRLWPALVSRTGSRPLGSAGPLALMGGSSQLANLEASCGQKGPSACLGQPFPYLRGWCALPSPCTRGSPCCFFTKAPRPDFC